MRSKGCGLIAKLIVAVLLAMLVTPLTTALGAPEKIDWSYTNASSFGSNFVDQSQVTPSDFGSLELSWVYPFPSAGPVPGLSSVGQGAIDPPLVVNGVVYVMLNDLDIMAIDSQTGSELWNYQPTLNTTGLPLVDLTGHVHGITYYRGEVWANLPDCSVIALSADTGAVTERIPRICADIPGNSGHYDYAGKPVVFDGDVMIWSSSDSEGTDAGRGFVAAYNVSTGGLLWRWYVSPPTGGDPTWDTDSCPPRSCHGNVATVVGDWGTLGYDNVTDRAGAGVSWGQPAVDQRDDLIFVGTSQPSPDWNATYRPGPDLFSDSVVALHSNNGSMAWFFQTTPHDLYDFDCGWNVVLGNTTVDNRNVTTVFKGCKNGYLYALDARSGSLLWYFDPPAVERLNTANANYVATGSYDGSQRWINYPSSREFEQCPGAEGGIESDISVAYGEVFVATHNFCSSGAVAPVDATGPTNWGVQYINSPTTGDNTTIYAVNASTGKMVWSYFIPTVPYRGWLTATGGMVMASTISGDILALDARTGALVGALYVGAGLYEGVTVGSDLSGRVMLFQLFGSPNYGAFASGVPGGILAYGLGSQETQSNGLAQASTLSSAVPWVLSAVLGAVITAMVFERLLNRRRAYRREASETLVSGGGTRRVSLRFWPSR